MLLLWWCIGEGSLRCSLNLSLKVLEVSPMYSSLQVRSLHWKQYMASLLLTMGSLSFGETSRFLMVLLPLKWVCIPYLLQLFNAFAETLGIWYYYMPLGFNFIGNRLDASGALAASSINDLTRRPGKSFLHLVQSHCGVSTISKCFPEMLHFFLEKLRIATGLALWVRVLMTLYLAERWWWLFHYKYWSMCVGFLYTVIDSLPSVSGFTMVSKKGMAPSSLLFSTVNCVAGSALLRCCSKFCLFFFLLDDKSVIYIQHHYLGGRSST